MGLFCQLWSCRVLIGVDMLTVIKKWTIQLVLVCFDLILCMPKSVISDYIPLSIKVVLKIMCCMCVCWVFTLQ